MATELKMPQMGYDMEEGTLVRWLKKEGAEISKNEAIAEIETDKAVVEFESESEGTLLKILAPEGTVVPVGQTIAFVGKEGDIDLDAIKPYAEPSIPDNEGTEVVTPQPTIDQSTPQLTDTPGQRRILATPVARRIADELGINLANVTGSGPGGRITKKDVDNFQSSPDSPTADVQSEQI